MSHIDPLLPEASDPQPVSSVALRQSRQPGAGLVRVQLSETDALRHSRARRRLETSQCACGRDQSLVSSLTIVTILSLASLKRAMGPGASVLIALSLVSPGLTQDYRSKCREIVKTYVTSHNITIFLNKITFSTDFLTTMDKCRMFPIQIVQTTLTTSPSLSVAETSRGLTSLL